LETEEEYAGVVALTTGRPSVRYTALTFLLLAPRVGALAAQSPAPGDSVVAIVEEYVYTDLRRQLDTTLIPGVVAFTKRSGACVIPNLSVTDRGRSERRVLRRIGSHAGPRRA
jgi:hypothetical protein